LSRLAADLGVRTPSLYSHVRGLDDLRHRLAARAAGELADAMQEAAAGRAGGDALRAVATAYREYAREHPGSYDAAQRAAWLAGDDVARGGRDAPAGDAGARAVRVFTAVLAGYGLSGDDAIHATRAVRAALHGFAALEAGGGFGMKQSVDESFGRLVALLDVGLGAAKP
jgi:AcrR family transcriptional regulator